MNPSCPAGQPIRRLRWDIFTVTFGTKSLSSTKIERLTFRSAPTHKKFTLATDIQVYFCDPQSPLQRGSNENTNGLLRQYMPKGVDISDYSQLQLNAIARQLNERPRKTLGFRTPAEMFSESVALTS
jgi:IS30 family transposase